MSPSTLGTNEMRKLIFMALAGYLWKKYQARSVTQPRADAVRPAGPGSNSF